MGDASMEEKVAAILNKRSEYLSVAQMRKLKEVMSKTFKEKTVNVYEISNQKL